MLTEPYCYLGLLCANMGIPGYLDWSRKWRRGTLREEKVTSIQQL